MTTHSIKLGGNKQRTASICETNLGQILKPIKFLSVKDGDGGGGMLSSPFSVAD